MEVGREDIEKFLALTERSAVAQEKLIDLATEERSIEFKSTPPFCPHCETVNPVVSSAGGTGGMDEFVLVGRCGTCGNILYGVPEGWQVYGTEDAARAATQGGGE